MIFRNRKIRKNLIDGENHFKHPYWEFVRWGKYKLVSGWWPDGEIGKPANGNRYYCSRTKPNLHQNNAQSYAMVPRAWHRAIETSRLYVVLADSTPPDLKRRHQQPDAYEAWIQECVSFCQLDHPPQVGDFLTAFQATWIILVKKNQINIIGNHQTKDSARLYSRDRYLVSET